jgi:GTP diphosphokinase / guanosine-3',5'-bis(diphosphate) 3'-diphosphatase
MTRTATDLNLIVQALAFAAHKHRDQRRKNADASPYINHPIALAHVLTNEAGVNDEVVICAALLHDTIEDTQTTYEELCEQFGKVIADVVLEVTDDKTLPKTQRKQLQIDHAHHMSPAATLVKLADKICNLRDMVDQAPAGWNIERKREYFDWAKNVIDGLPDIHPVLKGLFMQAYARRPD